MKSKMEYQKLFAVLGQDCCPICAAVDMNVHRFIDALLYENVTDEKIRIELRDANGLCHAHAWKLRSHGDPLAHAFIYGSMIKSLSKSIDEYLKESPKKVKLFNKTTSTKFTKLKHNLRPVDGCPICKMAHESELHYVTVFAQYIDKDKEFNEKFKSAGFLCMSHIRMLLDECGDTPQVRKVLDIQLNKLNSLTFDLDEIIRKTDYRFNNEMWTESEKTGWTRAVRLWNGEKE